MAAGAGVGPSGSRCRHGQNTEYHCRLVTAGCVAAVNSF